MLAAICWKICGQDLVCNDDADDADDDDDADDAAAAAAADDDDDDDDESDSTDIGGRCRCSNVSHSSCRIVDILVKKKH